MKKIRFSAVVLLVLMTFAACGSPGETPSSPSESPPPSSGSNTVLMKNHTFQPAEITISKGDTVTWTNEDSAAHDVAGDGFKSDSMKKGDTFSYTFDEAGTYAYTCTFHPGMNGIVIVN